MNTEKRMIHSYEVVSSLKIGEKEVVLAMDEKNTDGEKYMTCFVERNELFELYHESMLSDDYAEIAKIYGARIANEAELHIESVKKLGIPITVITAEDCIPDHHTHDINGKIIAINTKHLRPEFQRPTDSYTLCTADRELRQTLVEVPCSAPTFTRAKIAVGSDMRLWAKLNRSVCPNGQRKRLKP